MGASEAELPLVMNALVLFSTCILAQGAAAE